jgi:hypothetical protein
MDVGEPRDCPDFDVGDWVATKPGLDGTSRQGVIARRVWHHAEARYAYWMTDDRGRRVSRRYWAVDLTSAGCECKH